MAQVQPLARPGDGHVHQATLFFQAVAVAHRVFVREQALFHAGDEDRVELQPLAGVYRHQLHRVLPGLGLVVTRLQRRVRQKGRQRGQGLAAVGVGCGLVQHRLVQVQPLRSGRLAERVAAKAFDRDKTLGRVDQLLQVFHPVSAFAVGAVMGQQAAVLQRQRDDFAQVQALGALAQHVDAGQKGAQVGAGLAAHAADGITQGAAAGAGRVLQLLQAAQADAARREIDRT